MNESSLIPQRVKECFYRDRLAKSIPGSIAEFECLHGKIDVLTPAEVIEVKRLKAWRTAVRQVIAYGSCFPDLRKRIHLLCSTLEEYERIRDTVEECCESLNIKISAEEEVDEEIPLYRVGDREFASLESIAKEIAAIREQYTDKNQELKPDHKAFMLEIINNASWSFEKFGGKIEEIRVIPAKRTKFGGHCSSHFQVKSIKLQPCGYWTAVSIRNYLGQIPRYGQEGIAYYLKNNATIYSVFNY